MPQSASSAASSPVSKRKSNRKQVIIGSGLLALMILGGAYLFWGQKPAAQAVIADRPAPVSVVAASKADLNVYLNGLGTVTPLNTVTVRSRVDGELIALHFEEGQLVTSGALLAEIDPRGFLVQLQQAEAQLARDQALLTNAKQDLARYQQLLKEDSIAQQQVSTQEAQVRQYEAALKIDQAQINNVRLQLDYSRITAPITGRIGLRNVDKGNLVRAGDPNGLAVITQTQPIAVLFDIPEDALPSLLGRLRSASLPVTAFNRDQSRKLGQGQLVAVDNRINASTGMVRLKARFANADEKLFPNQFVNARLLLSVARNAIVIPNEAILQGAQGHYVWVIGPEQIVSARPIEVGVSDQGLTAVTVGLSLGEQVVVDGTEKLAEGKSVEIIEKAASLPASAKAP
ncbi:MAG: MdtA/MuxA family multidrug efflux RND transporter periplasmic adaptor subunit [Candidatus Macondimonas sp.]